MRSIWILTFTLFLSVFVVACGEYEDNAIGVAYPKIRLLMAPGAQHAAITRVVLSVSGSDIETEEFELDISDDGKTASGAVLVAFGIDRRFIIQAYSGDEVAYTGEELVDLLEPEVEFWLEILLEPITLNIRIVPSEIRIIAGNTFDAEIKVGAVRDLFGVSFELEYDADVIRPLDQELPSGDFLGTGGEILFLSKIDPDDPGRYSIGITRKAGAGGVDGSGVIARVEFQAFTVGQTELKLVQNDNFAFRKEDGADIENLQEIVIENAQVIVE